MSIRVCVVCREQIGSNVDITKLVDGPELELSIHNIPATLPASRVNLQLPAADFYVDNLPEELSHHLRQSLKQSSGDQVEEKRVVQLLAGQSYASDQLTGRLVTIGKELQDPSASTSSTHSVYDRSQLDKLCQALYERQHKDRRQLAILVFTSGGLTSTLVIAEHTQEGRRPAKLVLLENQTAISIIRNMVSFIINRPCFAEINGCLRVDLCVNNVEKTITDLRINLSPQIFCQKESQDDWMVKQMPGGHEALLCNLLTRNQQKSQGLTAKQATVCHAFDVISSGLASSYDRIAHVAVMRSLAFQYLWEGTTLDVGCGQGVWGGLLALYHRDLDLHGLDMSEAMINAPQIRQHYQSPIHIGPMEQTLISSPAADHITCFSVFQYVTPMTFITALSQMFLKAQKSITFDIPEVSQKYEQMLVGVDGLLKPTDHLRSLERMSTPAGWKMVMNRYCLTYTEPNYDHDLYSRYVRFERVC